MAQAGPSHHIGGDRRQLPQSKKKSKADEGPLSFPPTWKEKLAALGDVGPAGILLATVLADIIFLDVKGLVQPLLVSSLLPLRRMCPELQAMLDRHVDGFLAHAMQAASDPKKADIAEEAALTLKFVCEERDIFSDQLHRCMPILLRLLQLRLGAVVEIFYAPDDVNVSVATYQAEILLKAFYGLQLSCPEAFRTLCAPFLSAKAIRELQADSALVALLWKLLLRFVLSPKCPVPNVGPAGIAFCFILLSVGSPAQSIQHILSFFFPQLLAPDAPAVTFEPSTLLLLEAPFRDFVSKLPPLPLTMLLRGVVIAGPTLMAAPVNGRSILLIEAFFPLFSSLCENTTACEQSTRVAVFQSLSIVCHKMREIFEGPPPLAEGEAKPPPPIAETLCITPEGLYALLGRLLRLALSFWEESNDGVVIQVKSQFADLCDMHTLALKRGVDSAQHVHFTEELFARVAKLRWVQKAKYAGLQSLIEHYGANRLLVVFPSFLQELFLAMGDVVVRNPGGHLLSVFLSSLKSEASAPGVPAEQVAAKCLDLVLPAILSALLLDDAGMRDGMISYALEPVLQVFPIALQRALAELGTKRHQAKGEVSDAILWAMLALLKTARQLGQFDAPDLENIMHDPSFPASALLEAAITHNDEELRNIGLEVVCVSAKLTEEPSPLELKMVQLFFAHSLKSSSAGFRQRCVVRVKKFFLRLKESARRHYGKSADRAGIRHACKAVAVSAQRLVAALYPGAPFQRKIVPMELYEALMDVWGPQASEGTPVASFLRPDEVESLGLFSPAHTDIVLDCLWDLFDRPRQLGFEMLAKFPTPLPSATSIEAVTSLFTYALRLICSPRARETDSGALLIRLLFRKYVRDLNWRVKIHPTAGSAYATTSGAEPKSTRSEDDPCLFFIHRLVELLDSHIAAATANLAQASQRAPMHGVVLALRYVSEEAELRGPAAPPKGSKVWEGWRNFFVELTVRVKSVFQLALKVVGDIAPEGFKSSQRPSYHEEEFYDVEEEESSEQFTGNKGQILLVCAWVSVKEMSMLIGTLLSRVDLPEANAPPQDFLLSVEQIRGFGDTLLHLLLSTMHNGAVEGAHMGFQTLCTHLLRAANPTLFGLPRQWLTNLLFKIENETLIITRRSSGLPPAFSSILRAEVASGIRVPTLFPLAYTGLLRIANASSTLNFRPAVHSLHVLRNLSHGLAAEAAHYLADAFMLAIRGYTSENWPVRNSSTMLFSVLVDKMAGAKRGGADIAATTVESFFARFPTLHDFLLAELRRATSGEERTLYSALYPILVLFSRLLPAADSATGGRSRSRTEEARQKVDDFVAPVSSCHSQHNFKIRDMAARALVPLVPPPAVAPFLVSVLQSLPTESNALHGRMSQLRYLAASVCKYSASVEDIYNQVVPLLLTHLSLLARLEPPSALMFFEGCAAIVAVKTTATELQRTLKQRLLSAATRILLQGPIQLFLGPVFRKAVTRFALRCALGDDAPAGSQVSVAAFVLRLLSDADYEVRKCTLKALIDHANLASHVDFPALRSGLLVRVGKEQHNRCLCLTLELLHHVPAPSIDAAAVLWPQLLRIAETHAPTAGLDALALMGHCLKQWLATSASAELASWSLQWIKSVREHSRPSQPLNWRAAAVDALAASDLPAFALNRHSSWPQQLADSVVLSWLALAQLLQDDDEGLRATAATYCSALASRVKGGALLGSAIEVSRGVEFCFEFLSRSFASQDVLVDHFESLAEQIAEVQLLQKEWDPSGDLFEREADNFWNEALVIAQLVGRHLATVLLLSDLSAAQQARLSALQKRFIAVLKGAHQWLQAAQQSKWQQAITCVLTHRPEIFEAISAIAAVLPALAQVPSTQEIRDESHAAILTLATANQHPLLLQTLAEAGAAFKPDSPLVPVLSHLSTSYLISSLDSTP